MDDYEHTLVRCFEFGERNPRQLDPAGSTNWSPTGWSIGQESPGIEVDYPEPDEPDSQRDDIAQPEAETAHEPEPTQDVGIESAATKQPSATDVEWRDCRVWFRHDPRQILAERDEGAVASAATHGDMPLAVSHNVYTANVLVAGNRIRGIWDITHPGCTTVHQYQADGGIAARDTWGNCIVPVSTVLANLDRVLGEPEDGSGGY